MRYAIFSAAIDWTDSTLLRARGSFFPPRLQAVEDVNVTYEDQQRINKFARNTSRMTELKNEIESKKVSIDTSGVHLPCVPTCDALHR